MSAKDTLELHNQLNFYENSPSHHSKKRRTSVAKKLLIVSFLY